jgi:hypothetical protein
MHRPRLDRPAPAHDRGPVGQGEPHARLPLGRSALPVKLSYTVAEGSRRPGGEGRVGRGSSRVEGAGRGVEDEAILETQRLLARRRVYAARPASARWPRSAACSPRAPSTRPRRSAA